MSADHGISGCSGCARLQRRLEAQREQIVKLQAALEESRRAGKRQASPFSKGRKADPKRPGRKRGEGYGKQANRPVPDHVDEVYDAPLPVQSPCCQCRVIEDSVQAQYQTEIPPVKPIQRRFDVHVGHCASCGKRMQGRHAKQTSDALGAACSQLGPHAISFSAYLHQDLGLPYRRSSDLLRQAFGLVVTAGGLSQALTRLARRAAPSYSELRKDLRESEAVYPDETSARMNGERWWLWVFTNPDTTVYVQRPSRGSDVIEEVLGMDFAGLLGHDGWAPYDQLVEAVHQQCLAHLIRRAKELEETATRGAVRFPRLVKEVLQDALRLRDRREAHEVSSEDYWSCLSRLEERVDRIVQMHLTHEGNRRFQAHLARHGDELLIFLYAPVEATNWRAEQAIRPAVRFRKISGGHRSTRGAWTRDVLLSVMTTARQRRVEPIDLFGNMLRSKKAVLLPAAEGT